MATLLAIAVAACACRRRTAFESIDDSSAPVGSAADSAVLDTGFADAAPAATAPTIDAASSDADAGPVPEKLACASDQDCTVSCVDELGGCCPPCRCDTVANRKWAEAETEKLKRLKEDRCKAVGYCVPRCPEPTHRTIARCAAGRCVGERVPIK